MLGAQEEIKFCGVSRDFPGKVRQQCDVGSCHAFTTVPLLEHAIYRQHGIRIALSEADLFVRRTVMHPRYYETLAIISGRREVSLADIPEGNSVQEDLTFAIENGLARQDTVPYAGFLADYRSFRQGLVVQLNLLRQIQENREKFLKSAEELSKALEEVRFPTNLLLASLGFPPLARPEPLRLFLNYAAQLNLYHWLEFQTSAPAQKNKEDILIGLRKMARIQKERDEAKRLMAGFRAISINLNPRLALDNAGLRALIKHNLCVRKRPVGISYSADPDSNHAIVLTGCASSAKDPISKNIFIVRNSSAENQSYDLLSGYEVYQFTIALAPKDPDYRDAMRASQNKNSQEVIRLLSGDASH